MHAVHEALSSWWKRVARTHVWAIGAVFIVALAVRVAYLFDLRTDVLFEHPVLDAGRYVDSARALAEGRPLDPVAHWQPPGIVTFLALLFRLAGPGVLLPMLLQALLGAATVLLVYAIARRFVSPSKALVASCLVALHGVLIHGVGDLLPATWMAFFNLSALLLLIHAKRSGNAMLSGSAGLSFGISTLFSPMNLPFLPFAGLFLWKATPRRLVLTAFFAGMAIVILPVTYRNYRVGGEFVLVSTNGGINFFLGNNDDYLRTLAIRPGPRWQALVDEPRIREGITRPGQESNYFVKKTLSWFAKDPLHGATHLARKMYLFFHGFEIPRDTDVYADRSRSITLRLLVGPPPWHFPNGLILPLALLGIAISWRRSMNPDPTKASINRLLTAYVLTQAFAVSLFFVTSRYRIPAMPVLCIFTAVGTFWLIEQGRQRAWRSFVPAIAGTIGLTLLLNLPVAERSLSLRGEADFYRGIAHEKLGAFDLAEASFRAATQADPEDARPWRELANLLESHGDPLEAAEAWTQAADRDPQDVSSRRRAGSLLILQGDESRAQQLLENNILAAKHPTERSRDRMDLANLHARAGRTDQALNALREAVREAPPVAASRLQKFFGTHQRSIHSAPFWREVATLARSVYLHDLARRALGLAKDIESETASTPTVDPDHHDGDDSPTR